MNNVVSFPNTVRLHEVENGDVFRVIHPKVEGRNQVRNDGLYKKVGDSHSVQISNTEESQWPDVILHRSTIVRVLPKSRFAGAMKAAVA